MSPVPLSTAWAQSETPFPKEFTMWLTEAAHVSKHLQKLDNGKFLQSHLALPFAG